MTSPRAGGRSPPATHLCSPLTPSSPCPHFHHTGLLRLLPMAMLPLSRVFLNAGLSPANTLASSSFRVQLISSRKPFWATLTRASSHSLLSFLFCFLNSIYLGHYIYLCVIHEMTLRLPSLDSHAFGPGMSWGLIPVS